MRIKSILLVDDENLFHLVFEDACSMLDITLSLESISSAEECERLFKEWQQDPAIVTGKHATSIFKNEME